MTQPMTPSIDQSPARWSRDEIFSDAEAYDLAFAWDVRREIDVVTSLARVTPERGPVLLPACGTGRYALGFAERGFEVAASDINQGMLAIAERRRHPRVSYACADMTKSLGTGTFAAAFTFTNSFRYLLRSEDVDAHLRELHARLAVGGTYVIDLGLTHGDEPRGQSARWTVRYSDSTVRASWSLISTAPPLAIERARILVEHADGTVRELVADQPQRIWSFAELAHAAERAGFAVRGPFRTNGALAPDPEAVGRYYVALDRP